MHGAHQSAPQALVGCSVRREGPALRVGPEILPAVQDGHHLDRMLPDPPDERVGRFDELPDVGAVKLWHGAPRFGKPGRPGQIAE